MVSFSCENCGDVLTKKKLDSHRGQCRGASFTCIDCMVHFHATEYRSHTSCISEAQKYQGALYKEKKGKQNTAQHNSTTTNATPAKQSSKHKDTATTNSSQKMDNSQALVARNTYIHKTYTSTAIAIVDAPPEAPEPPQNVNVFDFLLPNGAVDSDDWESERDDDDDMRPEPLAKHDQSQEYLARGFSYGDEPVAANFERFDSHPNLDAKQAADFITPAPQRSHNRNISMDSTGAKKSGKRKRGHPEGLDLAKDVVMTDAAPPLHSGLTGGMNRLLNGGPHGFPPSPDLSVDAHSPQSPIKRSRGNKESSHRREKKERRKSDSDKERKPKKSKSEDAVTKRDRNGHALWERRRTRKRSPSPSSPHVSPNGRQKKQLKALEYPDRNLVAEDMSKALVRIEHAPTTKSVDMFLSCLVKGSETDEGVSVYKALKRWRRDGGSGEKELWKRLKIRANEHGDLVLCV
ncbi:hypothetical protein BT63DRAFT_461638 [Microthyrium microscopicum]|uniref:Zinc finger C2H2 LYAR-type domain-containing protein n=1 Tax=Microthyrium microscopicum TaxID=703497 RepID=A0A6A6TTN3_9PEZI|nr:hypothetical protein BT63DRAFT_461638 [Microthyrium microscopicum]